MTASAAAIARALPRLEYGKFCFQRNGAIEPGADHRILGQSDNFPQALVGRCTLQHLSLGKAHADVEKENVITAARPYGTVIRPWLQDGKCGRVAYRVGQRSEGGSIETRYYWVARYLFDPFTASSPYDLYKAIGELEGIARGDIISPTPIVPSPASIADSPPDSRFLVEAVAVTMSGISFELQANSEEEFFHLVSEVWSNLPSELRPYLSAGWNVASSLTTSLGISFAPAYRSRNARYQVAQLAWNLAPPKEADQFGRPYALARLTSAEQDLSQLNRQLGTKQSVPFPAPAPCDPAEEVEEFPAFCSNANRQRFRHLAGSTKIQQLIALVCAWNAGRIEWTDQHVSALVKDMAAADRLSDLFEAIHNADGADRSELLLEALAWESLAYNPQIVNSDSWLHHPRLRLITALFRRSAANALAAYASVTDTARWAGFDGRTLGVLHDLFPDSLNVECLPLHQSLLQLGDRALDYQKWLVEYANEAAIHWAVIPSTEVADMQKELFGLVSNPALSPAAGSRDHVSVYVSLSSGDYFPNQVEAVLGPVDGKTRNLLSAALEDRWLRVSGEKGLSSSESVNLAQFAAHLEKGLFKHPLLKAAANIPLSVAEMHALVSHYDLLEAGFFCRILASQLFYLLPRMKVQIEQRWNEYVALLRFWNDETFNAVFGASHEALPPSVLGIEISNLVPFAGDIPLLWEAWHNRATVSERRSLAIGTFRSWCLRAPGSSVPPFVRAVRIAAGANWDEDGAIEPSELLKASDLIASMPNAIKYAETLWNSARQGWQSLFVLYLFPEALLVPSVDQLSALVPFQKVLFHSIHFQLSPEMAESLLPAKHEFYSPGSGEKPLGWQEQYRRSALWGGFGELPAGGGEFLAGLQAYGGTTKRQAWLCRRILETHIEERENLVKARGLIVRYFLAPQLGVLSKAGREQFWRHYSPRWSLTNLRLPGWVAARFRRRDGELAPYQDSSNPLLDRPGFKEAGRELLLLIHDLVLCYGGVHELKSSLDQIYETSNLQMGPPQC